MKSAYEGYTFPLSQNVNRTSVRFRNRYGIELAGDLYTPKNAQGKLAAIAVCGPFGAVKEQAAGLYADEMASRGFVAMAFDPSFIGESGGEVRNVASPDINTEDFSAAVDFLSNLEYIDPEKIGIIGICGFGGMGLNAAAMDTRIKATVTSTMYDMSRVNANGYFDAMDADARYELKKTLNAQRTRDYKNGTFARAGRSDQGRDASFGHDKGDIVQDILPLFIGKGHVVKAYFVPETFFLRKNLWFRHCQDIGNPLCGSQASAYFGQNHAEFSHGLHKAAADYEKEHEACDANSEIFHQGKAKQERCKKPHVENAGIGQRQKTVLAFQPDTQATVALPAGNKGRVVKASEVHRLELTDTAHIVHE